MKTFNRLVVYTVIASTTSNFLWFALTFWVYLETRSVIASSVIGGSYMLLFAASGIFFGPLSTGTSARRRWPRRTLPHWRSSFSLVSSISSHPKTLSPPFDNL